MASVLVFRLYLCSIEKMYIYFALVNDSQVLVAWSENAFMGGLRRIFRSLIFALERSFLKAAKKQVSRVVALQVKVASFICISDSNFKFVRVLAHSMFLNKKSRC